MNIFALSGLLIGIVGALEALLMFIQGKEKTHYLWGVFCLSIMIWGVGGYGVAVSSDLEKAILWWKIGYVGVIFIPIFLINFTYEFLEIYREKLIMLLYILAGIFLYANLFTDFFINEARFVFGQFYYISPTFIYSSFLFLFFGSVVYSLFKFWQAYKNSEGIKKIQLKYISTSLTVGFGGGVFSFLPVYNIDFYPFLNIMVSLGVILVAYAIFKHHLMNIRVIATEIFSGLLVITSIIPIFQAENTIILLIRIFITVITVSFAILLIRSVLREVKRREEIEILAQKLEKASKELKSANKELKRLDEAKSEFLSIASHQLRTPSTVIKGFVSMMLDGNFGKVPSLIETNLKKVYSSNERLLNLIENLLNISRIEAGRIEFDIKAVSLVEVAQSVVDDFQKKAGEKKIKLEFTPDKQVPKAKTDPQKVKEVMSNLIDNSIKYTDKGEIIVGVHLESQSIVFTVQDMGMGILPEDLPRLFEKFVRGKGMMQVHTEGTGLGLYYARMVIENMGGRIWAESEGKGKGSKFTFSLPMADKKKAKKVT